MPVLRNCIHRECILNIQINYLLKTSGFTESPLAHDICHAADFTFSCAATKRKGNSIFMFAQRIILLSQLIKS